MLEWCGKFPIFFLVPIPSFQLHFIISPPTLARFTLFIALGYPFALRESTVSLRVAAAAVKGADLERPLLSWQIIQDQKQFKGPRGNEKKEFSPIARVENRSYLLLLFPNRSPAGIYWQHSANVAVLHANIEGGKVQVFRERFRLNSVWEPI